MKKQVGFSLIELMITVVVITIITSVAIPSYRQHVQKSHRTDATAALLRIAAEQEKWYNQNNSYTNSLTDLKVETTANDFYVLEIDPANAATFTAKATARTTGPQKNDKECKTFFIDATGTRTAHTIGNVVSTTTDCWR